MASLAFLALTLLAIVDSRRGFLFTGARDFGRYLLTTPYFSFSPWQLLMLAIGLVGLLNSLRSLKRCEAELQGEKLEGVTRLVAGLVGLLVVDLFTYRGVPAVRAALAGIAAGVLFLRSAARRASSSTVRWILAPPCEELPDLEPEDREPCIRSC